MTESDNTTTPKTRGQASRRDSTTVVDDRLVPKLLLTYDEASWSLGISKSKLYAMVSKGEIPVVSIGGNTLFRPQDLQALADRNVGVRNR